MNFLKKIVLAIGAAQGLYAQTTGPTTDVYKNMNGEVSLLKYILQANTRVNMANFKDWLTWGAVNRSCFDPTNPSQSNASAFYTTKKIDTKLKVHSIQHCHGPNGLSDEGILPKGSTSFSWSDGQLFPKKAIDSKLAFYSDHHVRHYIPVTQGVNVSARVWLVTHAPSPKTAPVTGFRIDYYPGWDGNGAQPDNPSKTNHYYFAWENNTTPQDHAYTLNFTPPFTGTIAIDVGPDMGGDNGAIVWLKALTLQDGTSTGVVPVGSFVKNTYEQQYYLKFRHSGKVMVPDIGSGYTEGDPTLLPGEAVRMYTQVPNDKRQKWYIHPSTATGYSNIWTKKGALTSAPYWWHARSLTKPTRNDPWQQVQFVDQGNGYRRLKLGGKGPGGEDLYLISYNTNDGDSLGVYFGGMDGQEVQVINADPTGGGRYQVQFVHSGKCLSVRSGSTSDNAAVVQNPCNSSLSYRNLNMINQNDGAGTYRYSFAHTSTRRLDISSGSTSQGANVVNRASSSATSQQLVLMEYGDDTYSLYFKHSGLCLDIPGFSTADDVQAKQYPCNGGTNQRVRFIKN